MSTENTTTDEMSVSRAEQSAGQIMPTPAPEQGRNLPTWLATKASQTAQMASRPALALASGAAGDASAAHQTSARTGNQTLSVHGGLGAPASVADEDKPGCEIPAGLYFEGNATFPCSVTVRGRVKGSIKTDADADLRVAVGGEVEGDLKAKAIVIEGVAKGTIDATGGIASFGAQARCNGTILYARVSIAEGADIEATMKKST